ncbi:MAG: glycosyltransferase family 2 protein [Roseobacter sp.]
MRWGVVATVKASASDTLRFCAHHLEHGASRILIYLDAPNPEAEQALLKHPLCRVQVCDDLYWDATLGKRPAKHQVRQTNNASHAYARCDDVDWLAHIDVDEFLIPERTISALLADCPTDQHVLRVRPMEALAPADAQTDPSAFKCFVPNRHSQQELLARLYPTYHDQIKGGFLSHLAGKLFVRTGLPNVRLRIHNVLIDGAENTGQQETKDLKLAHLHARNWDHWRTLFDFRLEHGSYRADLAPVQPARSDSATVHSFLSTLVKTDGEAGLKHFFGEACADTPDLRARLAHEGLLYTCRLNFDALVAQHFPSHSF